LHPIARIAYDKNAPRRITVIYPDTNQIKRKITELLPDEEQRKVCLSLFLEALNKAHSYGGNKWSVYYYNKRVRLLVGRLIVFAIHKNRLWIALDKQLLNKMEKKRNTLEGSEAWQWDTKDYPEYKIVPSKNGYYSASGENIEVWPIIRDFNFEYIRKAASKYKGLNISGQLKCSPELLAYLRDELEQSIPSPNYGSWPDNIIYDIENFKAANKELLKTECEAIIQSRIGQGMFRGSLKGYWKGCAVTGCQSIEILKASHIKPWRYSNNSERLDMYNGLLLIPNLDSAFDKGFISFDNEGKIIISNRLSDNDRTKLGINPKMRIRKIETDHIKYLEYHRQNILIG